MDPITQGVLGAVAAQAVFGRRLPRSAALIGFAAGVAADLDVFIPSGGDPVSGLIYHRHFTHSLVFIPFGGLLVSALFLWWKYFKSYRLDVIGAAIIAYATHGILDAFTSYGTLLFWPFSNERIAWDLIGIVDPAFTIPLLVGIVWTLITKRPRAARVSLMVAAAYMCFGGWQHYRAVSVQQALAEARADVITHGRVMPAPGALVMWRSVYVVDGRVQVDGIRVPYFGETLVREGGSRTIANFTDLPQDIRAATDTKRIYDVFVWFADGLVTKVDGKATVLADQRFAADWSSLTPLWGVDFGSPSERPRRWRPTNSGRSSFGREVWRSLIYGDPNYRPMTEALSSPTQPIR